MSSVLVVEWTDAAEYEGWGVPDAGLKVISAGLFVDETDDVLTLARDFDPDTETWRGILCIPKCLIRSRRNG